VVMEGEGAEVAPPEALREAGALLETGEGDWAPRPAHSG
jgi:hypothetical protein